MLSPQWTTTGMMGNERRLFYLSCSCDRNNACIEGFSHMSEEFVQDINMLARNNFGESKI